MLDRFVNKVMKYSVGTECLFLAFDVSVADRNRFHFIWRMNESIRIKRFADEEIEILDKKNRRLGDCINERR